MGKHSTVHYSQAMLNNQNNRGVTTVRCKSNLKSAKPDEKTFSISYQNVPPNQQYWSSYRKMSEFISPNNYPKKVSIDLTAKITTVDIGKSPKGYFTTTNKA